MKTTLSGSVWLMRHDQPEALPHGVEWIASVGKAGRRRGTSAGTIGPLPSGQSVTKPA